MTSSIEMIIEVHEKDLGGFSVRRSLPTSRKRAVGPFVFVDHMGPADVSRERGMVVRAHPHIGLATVTYLFEGCITHRDSLGTKQNIVAGDVNWMTAGRGVVHSERSPASPDEFEPRMHGLQIWVALPKEKEEIEPSFRHFAHDRLPKFQVTDSTSKSPVGAAAQITLILGEALGHKSPVPVHSPLFYFDVKVDVPTSIDLPIDTFLSQAESKPKLKVEGAIYLIDGEIEVDGQAINTPSLAVFQPGSSPKVRALKANTRFVVFGGEALPEPRHMWWNFVSTSKERIEEAKLAWQNQTMGKVPDETEWIPLPER